tara:strand:+ start:212 stop:628 length:417 start_codon:yes stop_codon:yes gene_type:complete
MPLNRKLQGIMDGRLVKAMDDGEDFGFIPVVLRVNTAAGADNTVSLTMERKFTLIDVQAKNIGGAGPANDTLTIKNGSNAVTDVMDMEGAENLIIRALSIDDAHHEIAAGSTLNVIALDATGGDQRAKIVYITGYYSL